MEAINRQNSYLEGNYRSRGGSQTPAVLCGIAWKNTSRMLRQKSVVTTRMRYKKTRSELNLTEKAPPALEHQKIAAFGRSKSSNMFRCCKLTAVHIVLARSQVQLVTNNASALPKSARNANSHNLGKNTRDCLGRGGNAKIGCGLESWHRPHPSYFRCFMICWSLPQIARTG